MHRKYLVALLKMQIPGPHHLKSLIQQIRKVSKESVFVVLFLITISNPE